MVNYKHDPRVHNFTAAQQILPFIFKLLAVKSILDVGTGIGTWLTVAKRLGVDDILGIDGIELNENELTIPKNNFFKYDLTGPINLNRRFDLALCLEVAEHLPERSARQLLDTVINHSDVVVFGAAIPGQGGQNHLNEQWPRYWQNLFLQHGYYPCDILRDIFWNDEKIEWWYRQNIIIYAPKPILTKLNLPVCEEVKAMIHPELFNEKLMAIEELNSLAEREIWKPSFVSAFKRLIRSIIR